MKVEEENLYLAFRELFQAFSSHDEDRQRAGFLLFLEIWEEHTMASGEVINNALDRYKSRERSRSL